MTRRHRGLHDGVLLLGVKTGWTHAEILALPLAQFQHYLKRLTDRGD